MRSRTAALSVAILLIAAACTAATPSLPATLAPTATVEPAATATATVEPSLRPTLAPPSASPVPYAQIVRDHIAALMGIGLRVEGTDGERQGAAYIASTLEGYGYQPETLPFTAVDYYGNTVNSQNVVAVKSGRSSREIIVGAHYDSTAGGPGADDNASGVAMMLEMAQLLEGRSTPYTIRFVAFGAEEGGMVGSTAFVNQMSASERANTVGFVNLDSIVAGDFMYAYADEALPALRDWALAWAAGRSLDLGTIRNVDLGGPAGVGSGDYAPFTRAGIPFVYFEATDWSLGGQDGYTQVDPAYGNHGELRHTSYDTLAYVDALFPGRVDAHLNTVAVVLLGLLTEFE
jgi:hypothetical protein